MSSFALPPYETIAAEADSISFATHWTKCRNILKTLMSELKEVKDVFPDNDALNDFVHKFATWFTNRSIFDQPMMEYAVYGNKFPITYFYVPIPLDVPDKSCKSIFICLETIKPTDFIHVAIEFVKFNIPLHGTHTELWTFTKDALKTVETAKHSDWHKRFTYLRTNDRFQGRIMNGTSQETYEDACKYHPVMKVIEPPRMVFGLTGPILVGMGDKTIDYQLGNHRTTLKSVDPKDFK